MRFMAYVFGVFAVIGLAAAVDAGNSPAAAGVILALGFGCLGLFAATHADRHRRW